MKGVDSQQSLGGFPPFLPLLFFFMVVLLYRYVCCHGGLRSECRFITAFNCDIIFQIITPCKHLYRLYIETVISRWCIDLYIFSFLNRLKLCQLFRWCPPFSSQLFSCYFLFALGPVHSWTTLFTVQISVAHGSRSFVTLMCTG